MQRQLPSIHSSATTGRSPSAVRWRRDLMEGLLITAYLSCVPFASQNFFQKRFHRLQMTTTDRPSNAQEKIRVKKLSERKPRRPGSVGTFKHLPSIFVEHYLDIRSFVFNTYGKWRGPPNRQKTGNRKSLVSVLRERSARHLIGPRRKLVCPSATICARNSDYRGNHENTVC